MLKMFHFFFFFENCGQIVCLPKGIQKRNSLNYLLFPLCGNSYGNSVEIVASYEVNVNWPLTLTFL